ncbi:hypothetical protein LCGC14_0838090 [marine sediment metagenome]|uniref:Uncharacterized protein n=1 Tax=marine sediment metagenome TaxID=412755 RepID=A0A0F9RYM6_9ZZZZ
MLYAGRSVAQYSLTRVLKALVAITIKCSGLPQGQGIWGTIVTLLPIALLN